METEQEGLAGQVGDEEVRSSKARSPGSWRPHYRVWTYPEGIGEPI